MESEEVISLYEEVAIITDQMLAAARAHNWDQLAALESRCASHVASLRSGEPPTRLTGPVRERKVRILKKILADDREIRKLTEPWMVRLSKIINSAGSERTLPEAPGSQKT